MGISGIRGSIAIVLVSVSFLAFIGYSMSVVWNKAEPSLTPPGAGNTVVDVTNLPTLSYNVYNSVEDLKEAVLGTTPQIGCNVDFHNGEFHYTFNALTLPGISGYSDINMDVELLFTYRNRINYNGVFGYNWDFNYYKRVEEETSGSDTLLWYYDGFGRKDKFSSWDSTNNEWDTNPSGYLGKFTKDATNGTYKYTGHHGTELTFDSTGRLDRITDRNGNYIEVSWGGSYGTWQIETITDTTGRDIGFSYYANSDRLLSITDYDSRTITFIYNDSTDDLEYIKLQKPESTSADGDRPLYYFTYANGGGDLSHNLKEIYIPDYDGDTNSEKILRNYYFTASGANCDKIKMQDYGDQETFEFKYDTTNNKTIVINGLGHRKDYYWDSTYTNVPSKLYEYTYKWFINYASPSDPVVQVLNSYCRSSDPNYFETQYEWDSQRRLTKLKDKLLSTDDWKSVNYKYMSNNLEEIRYKDNDSNPEYQKVLSFTYDTTYYNLMTSKTDECGNTTNYKYDFNESAGNDFNDDGITTETKGNLVQIVYPNVTLPPGSDPSTLSNIYKIFLYRSTGQLTKIKNERGIFTEYQYYTTTGSGALADFVSKEIKDGSTLNIQTEYEYDARGNVTKVKTNSGNVVKNIEYNQWDLKKKIYYSGSSVGTPISNYETQFYYYDTFALKQKKIKNVDSAGDAGSGDFQYWDELYEYNDIGKVSKKTAEVVIDDDGLSVSDAETEYDYDNHYNLKQITFPEGNVSKILSYDERNLKFRITHPTAGTIYEQFDYNYNGNLTKHTMPVNDSSHEYNSVQLSRYTEYQYDYLGRKEKEIDPNGDYTLIDYNKNSTNNNIVTSRYDNDTSTLLEQNTEYFNERNWLWKESKLKSSGPSYIHLIYKHDKCGNVEEVTQDGESDITTATNVFDEINRLKTTEDSVENITEYEYEDCSSCSSSLVKKKTYKEKLSTTYDTYITEYGYDALKRKTSLKVYEKGTAFNNYQQTLYAYDSMGNVTKITDNEGNLKEYYYGGINNKLLEFKQTYDGTNMELTKYYWDENGNLVDFIDDENVCTHYIYNSFGQVTDVYYDFVSVRDGGYDGHVQLSYNNNNKVFRITDQRGVEIDRFYNNVNLLSNILVDDNGSTYFGGNDELKYEFDAAYRLSKAKAYKSPDTTPISESEFVYDELSRVVSEKQKLYGNTQRTISTDYCDKGIDKITYPNLNSIEIDRTNDGKIDKIRKDASNDLVNYTYNGTGCGLINSIEYLNDATINYGFDDYKRWDSILHKDGDSPQNTLKSLDYGYDFSNNKFWIKDVTANKYDVFIFNDAMKLTDAYLESSDTSGTNPDTDIEYNYSDYIGNRNYKDLDGTKTYYCNNDINECVLAHNLASQPACGSITARYIYDENGNRTQEDLDSTGEVDPEYYYYYDFSNNIVKITDGSNTIAEYDYDALGRRVMKDDQSVETRFYYNGFQVYEEYEYDTAEDLTARYIYGENDIDDIRVMIRDMNDNQTFESNEYYYYHKNHIGSVLTITDSNGDLAEKYTYLPFGNVTIYNENGIEVSSSAISNPYMFTGRRFDEESDRYYYRFRTYDSNCGQFMQRDSLGYIDGSNLYEYVSSNPTGYVDPFGTQGKEKTGYFRGKEEWGEWVKPEDGDKYYNCFAHAIGLTGAEINPTKGPLLGKTPQVLLDGAGNGMAYGICREKTCPGKDMDWTTGTLCNEDEYEVIVFGSRAHNRYTAGHAVGRFIGDKGNLPKFQSKEKTGQKIKNITDPIGHGENYLGEPWELKDTACLCCKRFDLWTGLAFAVMSGSASVETKLAALDETSKLLWNCPDDWPIKRSDRINLTDTGILPSSSGVSAITNQN